MNGNVADGIGMMMEDLKIFFTPIVTKLYPLIRFISIVNIYIVGVVFVALLLYMLYGRHHSVIPKLKESANYVKAGLLLLVYAILTEAPLRISSSVSLNLGLVVMPMAAKLFGPVLAGVFGILQYATSFIMHSGEAFRTSSLLIAGISGIIYGWIIYARRTSYLRCLAAKLAVNIVCNVLLSPMILGEEINAQVITAITLNVVNNIALAPVQALAIYVALVLLKKFKKKMREISWGF